VDCARCEELLIASLDGLDVTSEEVIRAAASGRASNEEVVAGGGATAALRAHLAACERCRELERLLAGAPEAVPPADLSESILVATSSRWAMVFERLDADLPGLASMEPDAAFTGDVLAATTGVPHADVQLADRDGGGLIAFWRQVADSGRLAALWQRLVMRPRLALEGAWVGALALALIVSVPVSRIDASPVEALAEIRQERVEPAIESVFDQVLEIGNQTRAAAAARARGVWTNRVVPALETGRRVWCESFGCEPTDDDTNDTDREPTGDINTNEVEPRRNR
jgi:hypothetical protein